MFDVEGVLAPVFTPINSTGHLNLVLIPLYLAYLNKHNISGVLVGGTTGEGMSLNVEEKKALFGAWVAAAKPVGMKVIVQIGGAPFPDVLALAKYAEYLKVDAMLTLPELYFKPTNVEQLVSYLKTISDAAPTRPLIYYHYPAKSGVQVNMRDLFSSASSKIPNFKGAKADLEVAEAVADQLAIDQKIFIGNHHIAGSVLLGHDSSITSVTNIYPELVKDIVDTVKNSDVMKANLLQRKLNRMVDSISSQGEYVASMKAAMELVTGIPVGPPRFPLSPLDENRKSALKNEITNFDI